jgi:hypothetical protein
VTTSLAGRINTRNYPISYLLGILNILQKIINTFMTINYKQGDFSKQKLQMTAVQMQLTWKTTCRVSVKQVLSSQPSTFLNIVNCNELILFESFVHTRTYPLLSSRHNLLWRDMESSGLMDVVTANRSRKNRRRNFIITTIIVINVIVIQISFGLLKITND